LSNKIRQTVCDKLPSCLTIFFNHNGRDIDFIWSKETFIEGPNSVEDEE